MHYFRDFRLTYRTAWMLRDAALISALQLKMIRHLTWLSTGFLVGCWKIVPVGTPANYTCKTYVFTLTMYSNIDRIHSIEWITNLKSIENFSQIIFFNSIVFFHNTYDICSNLVAKKWIREQCDVEGKSLSEHHEAEVYSPQVRCWGDAFYFILACHRYHLFKWFLPSVHFYHLGQ